MKHKYKATPPRYVIFCIIFTVIWGATPISASVTDNLQSIIVKILGQKNETTTKSNYSNASTNAKLNYLENEIANLKTKVEVKGGVPRILDCGHFSDFGYVTKSFTGPGRLVITHSQHKLYYDVDGVTFADRSYFYDEYADTIPFQSSLIIRAAYDDGASFDYILYEY